MRVRRFDRPEEFLEAAGPFLEGDEARNNLPLGVVRTCRDDPGRYPGPNYFAAVEDGGRVVAMAGAAGSTPNGARVGPVYTPPDRRRRGFATALVERLSARLLGEGRRYCYLFTDLANPVSNSIYPKVGYRPVGDYRDWDFRA